MSGAGLMLFAAFLWFIVYVIWKDDPSKSKKDIDKDALDKEYKNGYFDGYDDGKLVGYKRGFEEALNRGKETVSKAIRIKD